MWAGEDSDLHPLRDRFLKPACIPVSPPAQRSYYTIKKAPAPARCRGFFKNPTVRLLGRTVGPVDKSTIGLVSCQLSWPE